MSFGAQVTIGRPPLHGMEAQPPSYVPGLTSAQCGGPETDLHGMSLILHARNFRREDAERSNTGDASLLRIALSNPMPSEDQDSDQGRDRSAGENCHVMNLSNKTGKRIILTSPESITARRRLR
jgi:hypothetical protein